MWTGEARNGVTCHHERSFRQTDSPSIRPKQLAGRRCYKYSGTPNSARYDTCSCCSKTYDILVKQFYNILMSHRRSQLRKISKRGDRNSISLLKAKTGSDTTRVAHHQKRLHSNKAAQSGQHSPAQSLRQFERYSWAPRLVGCIKILGSWLKAPSESSTWKKAESDADLKPVVRSVQGRVMVYAKQHLPHVGVEYGRGNSSGTCRSSEETNNFLLEMIFVK